MHGSTSTHRGAMRRTTAIITTSAVVVAGGITGTVVWLSQPSYDDIVKGCAKALAAQSKVGGKGKPAACNDVKKGDYDALVLSSVIDGFGWTDKDGNFDENKMLDDATQP